MIDREKEITENEDKNKDENKGGNKNINKVFEFKMKVLKELYYNEQNFYAILEISTETELPESSYDTITEKYITKLVGKTIPVSTSQIYKTKAKLIYNEKYGYQYEIIGISPLLSQDKEEKNNNDYLKTIITEQQYKAITDIYPDIVSLVIENPEFTPDLSKLKRIGEYTWINIRDKIIKYQNMSKILSLLAPLGITNNMIDKLLKCEPNPDILKQKLNDNPYEFTKIKGFGFLTVDKMALKINPALIDSRFRVTSCMIHILEQEAQNGNLWLTIEEFGKKFVKFIPQNSEYFPKCFGYVKDLIQTERDLTAGGDNITFHVVDNFLGLEKYYRMEQSIWEHLKRINEGPNFLPEIDLKDAIKETNYYYTTNDNIFQLTDEQTLAIERTIDNKVSIITANAGCGKTCSIKGIINLYKNKSIVTACLSGKAARRIEEATQVPSNTIHKLLKWNPQNNSFDLNESNQLLADIIILDECSMIDDALLLSLLKAIPDTSKLIMVFDDAQLSPIGAGSPAKDLLKSNLCITRLTKIHRQAENSGIKIDANKVRKNLDIFTDEDAPLDEYGNRVFTKKIIHGANKDMEISMFADGTLSQDKIFNAALYQYFELIRQGERVEDILIIVPKKEGVNSTKSFNEKIQNQLLGHIKDGMTVKDATTGKEKTFKRGARVIQKVINDYERNVMNGEIGVITDVNPAYCTISFDDGNKIVNMPAESMRYMELAYCITCHSAQGSECKNIIIVLDNSHFILLDCALFYTAITRAQKKCFMFLQPSAYRNALINNKTERRTYLAEIVANDY